MAFLIVHWAQAPPSRTQSAIAAGRFSDDLRLVTRGDRWAAFVSPNQEVLVLPGRRGVIFGALFTRVDRPARVAGDDEASLARLAGQSKRDLVTGYWGRYVAVLDERDVGLSICRDPSGNLGCFHTRRDLADYVFSDVGLAVDLGLVARAIDWAYLAHHIAFGGARIARTGLFDVEELLPGDCLALSQAGRAVSPYWRPAAFLAAGHQVQDEAEAVAQLFAEIERSIAALASAEGSIVLELSGGLDSSIVAMALRGRPGAAAVNVTTSGPEGDERRYARLVAAAAQLPLTELVLAPSDIDFESPPAYGLARPGRSTVLQSVDAAFGCEGAARQATAFFNGTGGDSVFGYVTSAAPAADRLRAQGLGPGFFDTLSDIAALTGSTAWTVGRLALKIAVRRTQGAGAVADLGHLAPPFDQVEPFSRPWLEGLEGAPPGRRRHIEAITGIHGHMDGLDRRAVAPVIAPHVAQPVLEIMLRIPTWMNVAGGRDRAVARQAYASLLPRDVFNRRSKGRINRFIVETYQANRSVIERVLADGLLARQGVIDMEAVRATLRAPVEMEEARFMSVIRLVDAELWARTWVDGASGRSR